MITPVSPTPPAAPTPGTSWKAPTRASTNSTQILDVYQNRLFTKFGGGNGPYNREHTWPNSYGFSSQAAPPTPIATIFSCAMSGTTVPVAATFLTTASSGCTAYNTDVNEGAGGSGQANYRGSSDGETVWETWIGRRGDVARALFYMDVRYEGDRGGSRT